MTVANAARRYALNIGFNLLNKSIFKYFPYPYTVSTVHVVVGLAYCIVMYALGFKAASFGRVSAPAVSALTRAAPSQLYAGRSASALAYLNLFRSVLLCAQMVTGEEFKKIFGPASMHAIGHVAANISFAAVAISLTHTVKTLEPAFNVVLSKLILGENTPLGACLALIPIMVS